MGVEGVDDDVVGEAQLGDGDFVFLKGVGVLVFAGVDVDLVVDGADFPWDQLRAQLDEEAGARGQGLVVHPQHFGGDAGGHLQVGPFPDEDAAAGDVHFFIQTDRDRLAGDGVIHLFVADEDGLDLGLFLGRQGFDGVADGDVSRGDLPLEAAEGVIRAADPLHRHHKAHFLVGGHVHGFQLAEDGRAGVPRHVGALLRDVVPFGGGHRDDDHVFQAEFAGEGLDVLRDGVKPGLIVIHQVHLVDGEDKVFDAHEGADAGVALGLDQHALGGVDQDDGEVGERRADGHVPGVFLVARGVGDDEASRIGGEIAVGHVDGDALFPFFGEPVEEQRIVDGPSPGADFGIQLQSPFLIGVEQLRVVQDVADQRRFAVVDTAAGDKFK